MNNCSHCHGETTEMDSNIFTFRRIIRKREQTMVLCEDCRYEYKWDYEEEGWICDDDRDDRNDESNNQ